MPIRAIRDSSGTAARRDLPIKGGYTPRLTSPVRSPHPTSRFDQRPTRSRALSCRGLPSESCHLRLPLDPLILRILVYYHDVQAATFRPPWPIPLPSIHLAMRRRHAHGTGRWRPGCVAGLYLFPATAADAGYSRQAPPGASSPSQAARSVAGSAAKSSTSALMRCCSPQT